MGKEIIVQYNSMEIEDLNKKMNVALLHLEKEFQSLRTSRANPSMLDNIYVEAYQSKTPINQLGNISAPDPGTLTIQVWDNNLVKNIESAILESNLGLNPQTDGVVIRLPIPKLSEERRKELAKIAKGESDKTKITIRNVRKDANNEIKKINISKDIQNNYEIDIQDLTDLYISKVDSIYLNKEKEILTV